MENGVSEELRQQGGRGDVLATKEQVRAVRLALGLTQQQFGKLIGAYQCAVAYWETGRTVPRGNSPYADKLTRVLNEARDLGVIS